MDGGIDGCRHRAASIRVSPPWQVSANFSFSYTLPTILTQLGYTAETAQLMTVPM
jgi:hypothetical protein